MKSIQNATLLHALTPRQVTRYLIRRGWQRLDHPNQALHVFADPSNAVTLVLPVRPRYADHKLRMLDAIRLLTEYYAEDPDVLLLNIAHWDRDVVRIHIQPPSSHDQLLPFALASDFIKEYRKFMAHAATTQATPQRHHPKATRTGSSFADHCRFGHTFSGSFGFTIECPLELSPHQDLAIVQTPKPFARTVTERIATGYSDLRRSVATKDPGIIVANYREGFSGNMCEILTKIHGLMDEGLKFQHEMAWSQELHASETLRRTREPVLVDRQACEILQEASEELLRPEDEEQRREIRGLVTRLNSEKPPDPSFEDTDRTIVILSESGETQGQTVRVSLSPNEYRRACDAHKNGREVIVRGKLNREGLRWRLTEHDFFRVF